MSLSLEERIKRRALDLGASVVGIARLEDGAAESDLERLRAWLEAGYAGRMQWLARDPARRSDPRRSLASAISAVVLGFDYAFPSRNGEDEALRRRSGAGRVARYARGRDYHRMLPRRLERLLAFVREERPGVNGRVYVDTGPVLERAWAARAGVGWIGKHTLSLRQQGGSWFLLGVLLLDCALEPDAPEPERCGSCRRCIDVCPTGAIVGPYRLDARRCISYLTIELRGAIPRELRPLIGTWIFGCDLCQEVCPWNRHAAEARLEEYRPRPGVLDTPLAAWLDLDEPGFRRRFAGSPIARARRDGFLRNVCVALGNRGDATDAPRLARALAEDPSPLVRGHAAWALGRIGGASARTVLRARGRAETEAAVREEIEAALAGAAA